MMNYLNTIHSGVFLLSVIHVYLNSKQCTFRCHTLYETMMDVACY
jgi:hypothetical protein